MAMDVAGQGGRMRGTARRRRGRRMSVWAWAARATGAASARKKNGRGVTGQAKGEVLMTRSSRSGPSDLSGRPRRSITE